MPATSQKVPRLLTDPSQNELLSTLPPFLRVLLITDGTVTESLESYFWEPVLVKTNEQQTKLQHHPILAAQHARYLLTREARLIGMNSQRCYAHATSVIDLAILPDALSKALLAGEKGIGHLLRASSLSSYREVLRIARDEDGTLLREYLVNIDGQPAMVITERFVEENFASA